MPPPEGAARSTDPNPSDKNRSSSSAQKRRNYSPRAANDNSSQRQEKPPEINLQKVAPQSKQIPPSPTGLAVPSSVKKRVKKMASRSVGPEAIAKPVSQTGMAAQLGADQQRARLDQDPSSGQTREQMLADSSDTGSTVLPGQYDPLAKSGAYGRQATAPPGSMAETQADKDLSKEGGEMKTDMERQRAMQMEQQKMAAAHSRAGAGIAGASPSAVSEQEQGQATQAAQQGAGEAEKQTAQRGTGAFQAGQAPTGKGAAETAKAQQFAQAVGAERTAKTLQTVQSARGNIESAQKAAKAAKTFWNLIKTGELAAGITVVSLIVLFITANLQLINKYTFKNKIIPETYLVED
ncbi:hypothetical protein GF391_03300, partial [Candidatus Uhrbacteria bacterium]|nr:hypothetical protein [Candidatus Uhrbacteria bacterium]